MTPAKKPYELPDDHPRSILREDGIEYGLIGKLQGLKYEYRPDITDRAALEQNFREKFEALNRVRLTDGEFARLLDEIVTSDVFAAAKTLRSINSFTRDDGTPLNYTLVNIKDWCNNTFEVVNQLRINTDWANSQGAHIIVMKKPDPGSYSAENFSNSVIDAIYALMSKANPDYLHWVAIEVMTDTNQKQLGNTLWSIADQLRGAMDADDFRDYMLSFLFLRYLSDNYETAAKKELGKDYPFQGGGLSTVLSRRIPSNHFRGVTKMVPQVTTQRNPTAGIYQRSSSQGFLDYSNRMRIRVTEDSSATASSAAHGVLGQRSQGNYRGFLGSSDAPCRWQKMLPAAFPHPLP